MKPESHRRTFPTRTTRCPLYGGVILSFLLLFVTAVRVTASIEDGLILHYDFDEPGDRVTDRTGRGHDGKVIGARWVPDGVSGGAMYLAGPQHRIETTDEGFPEGDAPRSLSWWFAIDTLRPNFSTDFMYYGTKQYNQKSVVAIDWRHGRDCPAFSQWGGVYLSGRRIDQPLVWYHLVFTYGGNGEYAYYVNGERWHGYSEMRGPIRTRLGGVFAIGSHDPENVHSLGGFIDEVRVYNRKLNVSEVGALFAQGAAMTGQPVAEKSVRLAGITVDRLPDQEEATGDDVSGNVATGSATATPSRAPAPVPATALIETGTPHILRVGFSDHPNGDQDVTVFYAGETLHAMVQDVDLGLWNERVVYRLTLSQPIPGTTDVRTVADYTEEDENGVHRGVLSLADFVPGYVQIDLVGMDQLRDRIILLRSSWIQLK